MIKKTIITSLFIFTLTFNAYAFYHVNKSTTFHLSYKQQNLTIKGNYFEKYFLATEKLNLYKNDNKYIIKAFLNLYTAVKTNNKKYLKQQSLGDLKRFDKHFKQYQKDFNSDKIKVLGYGLFKDYAIIFLKPKDRSEKMIFVMEKDKHLNYKLSLDFKALYPIQHKIIEQSFKGYGDFIIDQSRG